MMTETTKSTTKEQCKPNQTFSHGWTAEEKKRLASVTFPLIATQRQYGQSMDAKLVMQGWELKLSGRFTVDQILYALDKYTDRRDDFPTPANLIQILEPEEPKVSEAQFVEAQRWQERNGYPMFSDAKDTIERYKRQNEEKREVYYIECKKISHLVSNSYNRVQLENLTERNQTNEPKQIEQKTNPDTEKAESGSAEGVVAEPHKSANQQGETGAHENAAS